MVVGEHVPDRFAEAAADLDCGDVAAARPAVPAAHPFGEFAVGRVAADGDVRCFDQRPA